MIPLSGKPDRGPLNAKMSFRRKPESSKHNEQDPGLRRGDDFMYSRAGSMGHAQGDCMNVKDIAP